VEDVMEYEIVSKESFPVIGVELKTTTQDGKNFVEIPQFWGKVLEAGQLDRIPDRKSHGTVLGICMDFDPPGRFSYIIGAEVSCTKNVPDDMVCKTIPAAEYAVFTARGKMPDSIQYTVKYIYNEWLPNSKYQRADSADFELYDERCHDEESAEVDIYVPIVPA
jgi:AraC family transcriptional regulator